MGKKCHSKPITEALRKSFAVDLVPQKGVTVCAVLQLCTDLYRWSGSQAHSWLSSDQSRCIADAPEFFIVVQQLADLENIDDHLASVVLYMPIAGLQENTIYCSPHTLL